MVKFPNISSFTSKGYLVFGISDVFITKVNVCQIRYYSIIRHGSRHAPRAVYKENDGTPNQRYECRQAFPGVCLLLCTDTPNLTISKTK